MKELPKPFQEPMDKLLAYKERTGLQSALAKRMSVGIYGKLLEERQDAFGPHFNPCWGVEISTQVRLKVAEFLYENDIGPGSNEGYQALLHISVDGCLLSEPVKGFKDTKIPRSQNGQWRLASITPAIVVSSGLVFYADKKPKGLSFDVVLEMLKEHPRVGHYEKRLKRRLTLADALARDELENIGKEVEMTSSIDFYKLSVVDRDFSKLPKSGGQLLNNKYKSKPRRITKEVNETL